MRSHGRTAEIVPFLTAEGQKVGSSVIRGALAAGEIERAAALLGRPFSIYGRVGHGEKRGRELGYRTANLVLRGAALPRYGVYATIVHLGDRLVGAVTNVGTRPTFGGLDPRVETHLLGVDERIYGHHIEVYFISRLRNEQTFPSREALITQIAADVVDARERLTEEAFARVGRWRPV
jgi:riboflavin kinase/FMN adenylyltransferase